MQNRKVDEERAGRNKGDRKRRGKIRDIGEVKVKGMKEKGK